MTDYNKLTVAKLKDLLKERGIPATGLKLKAHFVEALEKADGADETQEQDAPNAPEHDAEKEDISTAVAQEPRPDDEVDDTEVTRSDEPAAQTNNEDVDKDHHFNSDAQAESVDATEQANEKRDGTPAPVITTFKDDNGDIAAAEVSIPALDASLMHEDAPSTIQIPATESPAIEALVEDRLKRKRRSATPPVSESEVAKKKLRQDMDNGTVHLKEDRLDMASNGSTMLQSNSATTDIAMTDQVDALPTVASSDKPSSAPKEREGRYKDLLPSSRTKSASNEELAQSHDEAIQPSLHPASSAIYIRGLQRPLNPASLRTHLTALAAAPGADPQPSEITAYFVDSVKSHAFVGFDSLASAARVRANLHDRAWPLERDRKPLWVDFIPEDRVDDWISLERESESGGRAGSKRWEVSYDEHEDGMVARLVEVGSTSTARQVAPMQRPTEPEVEERRLVSPVRDRRPEQRRAVAPPLREAEAKKFINLDKAFSSTTTKPKLYFLPISQDLVEKRLNQFDDLVSREWSAKRGAMADEGELRRYTFEDGDVLVDSGFHPIPGRGRGRGGFGGGDPSRRGGYGRADAGYTSYRPTR